MAKQVTSFEVTLYHEGMTIVFYGDEITRHTTDGGGNPILSAPCWEVSQGKIMRRGVVNLTPEWGVCGLTFDI